MCNDYRNRIPLDALREAFPNLKLPGGAPNLEPRDDVRITDTAPVIRSPAHGGRELAQLRWSWPAPGGKPVYNFRSDGRRFPTGRCLIPADGFYDSPIPSRPRPSAPARPSGCSRLRASPGSASRLIRPGATDGADAFAMLTTDPGPDMAAYHARQVVCSARMPGRRGWTALSRRRCCGPRPPGRSASSVLAEQRCQQRTMRSRRPPPPDWEASRQVSLGILGQTPPTAVVRPPETRSELTEPEAGSSPRKTLSDPGLGGPLLTIFTGLGAVFVIIVAGASWRRRRRPKVDG